MARRLALRLDGVRAEVEVRDSPEGTRVHLDERWHHVDFVPTGRHGVWSLLIDGESWEVYAQQRPGGWDVLIGNEVFAVEVSTPQAAARARAPEPEGVWLLRSPLAGVVVEAAVKPGDTVESGRVLLVVESMKINNELTAARAGTVAMVYVQPGERVERGAPLLRIE